MLRAAILIAAGLIAAGLASPPAAAQSPAKAAVKQDARKAKTAKAKKASPAPAASRVWRLTSVAGTPTFQFGAPERGESLISFACQRDRGLIRVTTAIGSRGVRPGDTAPIRLSNGRVRIEIAGTAFAARSGETVDVGGATRIEARLFNLFRAGETLVVDVPGRRRGLSVRGAAASADAFEKACLPES